MLLIKNKIFIPIVFLGFFAGAHSAEYIVVPNNRASAPTVSMSFGSFKLPPFVKGRFHNFSELTNSLRVYSAIDISDDIEWSATGLPEGLDLFDDGSIVGRLSANAMSQAVTVVARYKNTEARSSFFATVRENRLLSNVLALSEKHTCAISDEKLVCWGHNFYGQLGNGAVNESRAPIEANQTSHLSVKSVYTGGGANCILDKEGAAWCWGHNYSNTSAYKTPYQRGGLLGSYQKLAMGLKHACALGVDGSVTCWGNGASGQLGGSGVGPQDVQISGATNISVGESFSCAVVAGGVMCWGNNSYGSLGQSPRDLDKSSVPVAIPNLSGNIKDLVSGNRNSCALMTDGSAYCWGENQAATLGRGTDPVFDGWIPGKVTVITDPIKQMAHGGQHICALTVKDEVFCWGDTFRGKLGVAPVDSLDTVRAIPVKVALDGTPIGIYAGANHTCATMSSGFVQCWGLNGNGQLGDDSATNRSAPQYVVHPR